MRGSQAHTCREWYEGMIIYAHETCSRPKRRDRERVQDDELVLGVNDDELLLVTCG